MSRDSFRCAAASERIVLFLGPNLHHHQQQQQQQKKKKKKNQQKKTH
jgi:hypothetical protein